MLMFVLTDFIFGVKNESVGCIKVDGHSDNGHVKTVLEIKIKRPISIY